MNVVTVDFQQKDNNKIYNTIQTFLSYKGENKNTGLNYKKDIEDFFMIARNKNVWELKDHDLIFDMQEVLSVREKFKRLKNTNKEKRYKNKSINRKFDVVRGLYGFLKANDYNVNPFAFKIKKLSEKDSEETDGLDWNEVEKMIDYVKDKKNGLEKSLMIELAATTGIRLNALVNIKWKDIVKVNEIYVINVYDKGEKEDEKPIVDDLYFRLRKIKRAIDDNTTVFNLNKKTFQECVVTAATELGFRTENRIISFHSLKRASVTHAYELSGNDITVAMRQGNHSNFNTTKKYIKKKKNYTEMGSYLIGKELDSSILENMSKEELFELIMDTDKATINKLINLAQSRK